MLRLPNLESIVLLLKFSTKLFQFLFQACRLREICSGMVSFLLQLVTSLLVLLILSLQTLHARKKFRDSILQGLDSLQVIHLHGEVVELSSILSALSFFGSHS